MSEIQKGYISWLDSFKDEHLALYQRWRTALGDELRPRY